MVPQYVKQVMKINELQLDEIKRLSPGAYSGGKSYLYPGQQAKQYKKLPGGAGLLYTIEYYDGYPVIKLWDSNVNIPDPKPRKEPFEYPSEFRQRLAAWEKRQDSGEKTPQIVGKLSLEIAHSFPIKDALQVGTITVDEDYRGAGLAKALYGIVLTIMKRPLVAGDSQTPGGRKNWVSLASIPGVEMKGYVVIDDFNLNSNYTKRAETNIDTIMGKLGGQYIGEKYGDHYFAFDVQPTTDGKELEAHVKQKIATIYGRNRNVIDSGLYATWTGQA
jgi:ribosomal protein S18 acetylase RimI-like enzyme